ncbi:carbohydrate ABC transporter permease [Nocardioides lianchengensis]|uniref:Cellobiose transport system permease protein n=1 Tax=Nocardioides lianchengensis TaxID=1045774 RepID=A0A1G7AUA8_9ACTN|nr:carbohydrate ABC transporter permease [Nocardioides lianchengensis]NYG13293.1 cellobiose transport system permease protein [Nocardioides lianchengensis]SDE18147.1 cellobiose transport system permease protein [Nocardioides lianchengensis]
MSRQSKLVHRPGWVVYGLLAAFVIGSALPLYWSFVIGSHTKAEAREVPPPLLPGGHFLDNARRVFDTIDFWQAMANSIIVSTACAASVVFFATLAGYSFAKLRFRGSNALMGFVVLTMAVPTQLAIVPLFIIVTDYGLYDTLAAVALPTLVTAFGVFFMRQYLLDAIPGELIEAARVDGASMIRTFWTVAVPAARPAMAILFLFTFMTVWTDYMWPLVALKDNQTLQVALDQLAIAGQGQTTDYALVLCGTGLATIPLLILFVVSGRQLVAGIMQGAVKG